MRRRVLIVDPYRGGRLALCSCVEELGYESLAASDIVPVANLEPDVSVVIVDHSPPWFDARRWITELSIPTIMLVEIGCAVVGLPSTILKPVSIVDLECALASATDGRQHTRPGHRRIEASGHRPL